MDRQTSWTPMQKVLFTSLVPVAAVVGALVLFSLVRSQAGPSPSAQASPARTVADRVEQARREERDAYRSCLKEMGANFSRPRFRSRFSAPPDTRKIREAMSVCRALLEGGGGEAPAPQEPPTPPIA